MKRNTTPTLPITIHMPFDDVQSIAFVFKYDKSEQAPELLKVEYETREQIPVDISDDGKSFVVKMKLKASQTMKLPAGRVYMDTQIVLSGGIIPATEIVEINDIEETLFSEVYGGD